jgi:hypothetical protein
MAKIIEHGKYWREDIQNADSGVLIKCPECDNKFLVSNYDCMVLGGEAWCKCGCKFIPETSDIVKEDIC